MFVVDRRDHVLWTMGNQNVSLSVSTGFKNWDSIPGFVTNNQGPLTEYKNSTSEAWEYEVDVYNIVYIRIIDISQCESVLSMAKKKYTRPLDYYNNTTDYKILCAALPLESGHARSGGLVLRLATLMGA